MLAVRCPRCQESHKIADKFAGKTIRCPACNKPIRVPMPAVPPDEDPAQKLDFGSLEAIEQGGETLEVRKSRWRKRMTLKEAQEASGSSEAESRPRDPNIRICPVCNAEVRASDPYAEILCKECDTPIPGAPPGDVETARYADSLAGRMKSPVTFYTGFVSAMAYPIPALMWILLGMGVALATIVVPVGGVLAFMAGSSLNPISDKTDFTWVGLAVTVLFVLEGIYFGLVDYHILIDSIRTTAAGGEQPPALTWNPTSLGAALIGYLALVCYYTAIFAALMWLSTGSASSLLSARALADGLHAPGNLFVVAIVTFLVPMNLVGLASGHPFDGLNPVRVVRSVAAVPGPYTFLFLVVVMYLGIYLGIMVAVMGWAGNAILTAARTGVQHGLQTMGMGLLAWAVVIGLGFFISYSLGRILGLFARTYRDRLDFDL